MMTCAARAQVQVVTQRHAAGVCRAGEATLGVVDSAGSELGVGVTSAACVRVYSLGSQDGDTERGHALARVLESGRGGGARGRFEDVWILLLHWASEILVF
jgi:hypothetical protein